jgi:4-hydroxythreonine-4-phosphate dehydrogenase
MPHVRPVVAITLGDPASVGPEIVVKALAAGTLQETCVPVVVGDPRVIERALATTGAALEVVRIPRAGVATGAPGRAEVVDVPAPGLEGIAWGRVQAAAGRAAFDSIRVAIELALSGEVDAVATAPVNKEAFRAAGVTQIGHTEIFGELTGTAEPLTLFEVKGLRVFFLTRHLSLAEAIRRITAARTLDALRRSDAALKTLGVAAPRIAVAALNPHGGEHGLFGDEEERELVPAVAAARAEGLDARGPYPADSVFWHAAEGRFDAVLSLYHDQGHVAAKMYDFERTVSITCGLPFLRTSVDHGTAFDIAGTGRASAVSMVEAVRAAARYAFAVRPRSGRAGDDGTESS